MLDEYSLWLEIEDRISLQLSEVIKNIAIEADSRPFKPHITLIGGINPKTINIVDCFDQISSDTKPFRLKLGKVITEASHYKSIFLPCEKDDKLISLNNKCQSIFNKSYEYKPHLSLLYSDTSQDDKIKIIKKYSCKKFEDLEVKIVAISLCYAKDDVDNWKILKRVALK